MRTSYDAVALAGIKSSGSSNLSRFRNSCRSSRRLTHIWKTIDPTDRYHSSLISNPGIREINIAGTANRISRVSELNSGGSVCPIPWKILEVTKTIPAEMKFRETIRRYSLPNAMTLWSLEKIRISVPGMRNAINVSTSIITDAMPIAE